MVLNSTLVPPYEIKGIGNPVVGSSPQVTPAFTKAYTANVVVIPPANNLPNESGALRAIM